MCVIEQSCLCVFIIVFNMLVFLFCMRNCVLCEHMCVHVCVCLIACYCLCVFMSRCVSMCVMFVSICVYVFP